MNHLIPNTKLVHYYLCNVYIIVDENLCHIQLHVIAEIEKICVHFYN